MVYEEIVTEVVGQEFDLSVKNKLVSALNRMGAVQEGAGEFSVGGSQELCSMTFCLNGSHLIIESEAYIGLSITGPRGLVKILIEDSGL